jgi:hypothetical protein
MALRTCEKVKLEQLIDQNPWILLSSTLHHMLRSEASLMLDQKPTVSHYPGRLWRLAYHNG